MVPKTKIEQVGKNSVLSVHKLGKKYFKITIFQDLQIMKSQNVVTGKNIAVLNYQFYSIINFFMSRAQNTKLQPFQHRLAEAAACKSLPCPTCDQRGDCATASQECTWAQQLSPSCSLARTNCSILAYIPKPKHGGGGGGWTKKKKNQKNLRMQQFYLHSLSQAHHPICSAHYMDSP